MTFQQPVYQPVNQPTPAPKRASRTPFWVGFAVGFALLMLASCGTAWFSLGLNDFTLAELRGDGEAWIPPTLMPTTLAPEPGSIELNPATSTGGRFAAGQTVRNITASRVNVRSTPGHLGKASSDILGQMAAGDAMVVQGESTVVDNLTWWRVTWQGKDGWVAEATGSGVQILGE